MLLNTCSSVISFAKELENAAAKFYQDLSQKYTQGAETFLSFAKENQKNIIAIERTYYGVISDAIEGGFAFNINTDEYKIKTELDEKASYSDALNRALEIEEKIIKFYSNAAEQSMSLMADIPRAFTKVARQRSSRRPQLKLLLDREAG